MNGSERFVGRGRELEALRRAWDRAAAGSGSLVVLEGEPGIGKTRLAREFAADCPGRLAWARSWDGGGSVAWWSFVQVARSLVRSVPDPEQILAAAGPGVGALLPERGAGASLDDRFAVLDACGRLVRAASEQVPLLIVLDDLHAADEPSLAMLGFLVDAIVDARVLVLATLRTVDARLTASSRALVASVTRAGSVLRVPPLDAWEVERMAAAWDPALDAAAARAVYARSRGNPLFVQGLVRAGPGGALPIDVRAALVARLSRVEASVSGPLVLAAVSGRAFGVAFLAAASGRSVDEVVAALDAARRLQLVEPVPGHPGTWDFAHPLLREVLADGLTEPDRLAAHVIVGETLERLHPAAPPLGELAFHFHAAAALDGGARGAGYALRAGAHAMEVAAFEEAVVQFERALALVPAHDDGGARLERLLLLGRARVAAGRTEAAREAFGAARRLARARGDAVALAAAAIGDASTRESGVIDERIVHLEEAAAALGEADSTDRVRVLSALASALLAHPDLARREALTARALAMARRLGQPDALAAAIGARLLAMWVDETWDERLGLADELDAIARRSGRLDLALEASRHRLNALVERGDMPRATLEVDRYTALATELRRPQLRFNALVRQGILPSMDGRFDEAEAVCRALVDAGRLAGDPHGELIAVARRVLLRAERGDVDGLREVLPSLAVHADRLPNFPMYRAMLAQGLCAVGDDEAARREWERCAATAFEDVPPGYTRLATLVLLGTVAHLLGDVARAKILVGLLEPFSDQHATIGSSHSFGTAGRVTALLRRLLGDLDGAVDLLERALARDRAMGAHAWVAHDLVELGRTLELRGGPGDAARAAPLRREGQDLAHRFGMRPLLHPRVSTPAGAAARLVRDGPGWLAVFDGRAARVKDGKGMAYLVRLLASPNEERTALDLAGEGRAREVAPSEALQTLDPRARAAYRARVVALRADIAAAEEAGDAARAERSRRELAFVARELSAAVGLGGRDRPAKGTVERARASVTKAIHRAILAIREEHPTLAAHLENAVRTGATCRYVPDRPIVWTL